MNTKDPPTIEHGFYRTENHTIMSGRVVRWDQEKPDSRLNGMEVSASRDGVMVQGYSRAMQSVDDLKAVLDLAQAEHEAMRQTSRRGFW